MRRHFLRFLLVVLVCALVFWYKNSPSYAYVNIYNWYAMLPADVLEDFTRETGIHVRLDFYDNNDVVETKLFAGNAGYDIVFPSASPYLSRQIRAGIFQPLDKTQLPYLGDVDPTLMIKMEKSDPGNRYSVPYYWGTLGFAYNEEKIKEYLGNNAPLDSYQLLFDATILEKLAPCGVTLLEEAVDVYPLLLLYLGKNPHSTDPADLNFAHENLMEIRPFIRRFSASRLVGELVSGETCLAQAWSGDTQTAIHEAAKLGRTIKYVIPKEGSSLWIDAVAIPKDAPHPKNAHVFINFILRADIAARIAEFVLLATPTISAKTLLPEKLRRDETLFPPKEIMDTLSLDQEQDIHFERQRNRLWTNFRLNRRD